MSQAVPFTCPHCSHYSWRTEVSIMPMGKSLEDYYCNACDRSAGKAICHGVDFRTQHIRDQCEQCAKDKVKQDAKKLAREQGKLKAQENKEKQEQARLRKLKKEKKWQEEEERFNREIEERERLSMANSLKDNREKGEG